MTASAKVLQPKPAVVDNGVRLDLRVPDDFANTLQLERFSVDDDASLALSVSDYSALELATSDHIDICPVQDNGSSTWSTSPQAPIFSSMTLYEGFEVTTRERQAVQHFQTRFSLSRSTKSPPWSTHSLILYHGMSSPMVMHLVIASAMADLSLRSDESSIVALARRHYRIGAQLLSQSTGSEQGEHANVLTCFFLLYIYLMMREDSADVLSHLSLTTLGYIQRFNLDGQASSAIGAVITDEQRTFVSRMIVWLLYEDIAISFIGHEAHFAKYGRQNQAAMQAVYEQSSATFETCWGSFYPDSEAIDDVENSTVLRFLFAVMGLLEDINQADTETEAARIEYELDSLQEKSKSLIRLTSVKDNLASRLLVNVDWTVALFYSLRVYLFRRLDGITPSEKVTQALTSMLLIAQRRLSSGRDDMFRRLEMPLFMAAIESTDPIHREWVTSKLLMPRNKRAATKILQLQHEWGVRASWTVVLDTLQRDSSSPSITMPEPTPELFYLE